MPFLSQQGVATELHIWEYQRRQVSNQDAISSLPDSSIACDGPKEILGGKYYSLGRGCRYSLGFWVQALHLNSGLN